MCIYIYIYILYMCVYKYVCVCVEPQLVQMSDSSQGTVGRSSPILKRDVGFGIRAAAGIPELLQLFGKESEVVELLASESKSELRSSYN